MNLMSGGSPATGVLLCRLNTATVDGGSGARYLTGFDSVVYAHGMSYDVAGGTVTVPRDGLYAMEAHTRFDIAPSGYSTCSVRNIRSGADVMRGHQVSALCTDMSCSGMAFLDAATTIGVSIYTAASAVCIGNAPGNYYYFRVARIG